VTWTAWFVIVVTGLVIVGLARNLAADALLWGAVIICGLAGILSLQQMFVGFTNTGMLTIAALFVVAAGVRETGALDLVGRAGWRWRCLCYRRFSTTRRWWRCSSPCCRGGAANTGYRLRDS